MITVRDDGANLIHGCLAGIRGDDFLDSVKALGTTQIDGLLEIRQFGLDQRHQRHEPALLIGIVAGQLAKFVQRAFDLSERRLIRLKVIVIAGDEIAALAGFGAIHFSQ